MNKSQTLRGYLMVFGSALCFGSYGVWSRFLGNDFDIFFQGWVRSAIILIILLPIVIIKKDYKPVFNRKARWFWITMVFTVFTQVPLYFAFNHLALGTATLIFYSLFLITSYTVGWLFLGERITKVKILSIIVALVGLFITFGLSLAVFTLFALLMAALNGIASGGEVATSKKSTQTFSSLQVVTYSWICILVTHLPLSLIFGERISIPLFSITWLAMLGYAISGLLGFWLVIEGFKYIDASIGGLIGLFEIIFSIFFGIAIFKDQLTLSIVLGGILIITAAIIPDISTLLSRNKLDRVVKI